MKLASALLLSLGMLPSAAAAAQSPPRFDAVTHCKEVAGFGGTFSESLYEFCLKDEQSAYDEMKAGWSQVSPQVAAHCQEVASFGGPGSYTLMRFCINDETEAKARNSGSTFRY